MTRRPRFDIIGDVHGCLVELEALLEKLGYALDGTAARRHPADRTAVFVGDLVDRGPDTVGVLRLVMKMVAAGTALSVLGNHEAKLLRRLRGRATGPRDLRAEIATFLESLPTYHLLDDGKLVVAHVGGRDGHPTGATLVHGHTTVQAPTWDNDTICIDTGCVYGRRLTALRYPERDLVSVAAQRAWAKAPSPADGASVKA